MYIGQLRPPQGDVPEHLGHAGEVRQQVQDRKDEGHRRGGVQRPLRSLPASGTLVSKL
jgi:hypothetical protein